MQRPAFQGIAGRRCTGRDPEGTARLLCAASWRRSSLRTRCRESSEFLLEILRLDVFGNIEPSSSIICRQVTTEPEPPFDSHTLALLPYAMAWGDVGHDHFTAKIDTRDGCPGC